MQTVLSVVMEVQPESAPVLRALVEALRRAAPAGRLMAGVPNLHFMSMSIFAGADYDPLFVIEANFDGPAGPFWPVIEATLGPELRALIRCCKRPSDEAGPLYDAVTAQGSVRAIAPYLESRTQRPSVFHCGNRGLARERIVAERALFLAVRDELARPAVAPPYRGLDLVTLQAHLRAALIGSFPWLDIPAPPRIPTNERVTDWAKLIGFAMAVLFCLGIPGGIVALIATTERFFELFGFIFLVLCFLIWRMHAPLAGAAAPRERGGLTWRSLSVHDPISSGANPITLAGAIVAALLLQWLIVSIVGTLLTALFAQTSVAAAWGPTVRVVGLGLVSVFLFSLPLLVVWLRTLERRDSSHDAPALDPALVREMARREDRATQNHMGSVVLIKPGLLRTLIIRLGHLGLGLMLRITNTDGYLGSMRTVHFAHWAFVNNGSRLMFFSNFDHSWESYLDDFIEKAHGGLTLAWGCGTGFPPTRFLVLDGASHGRKFKAWARHSMTVTSFWFSAYPDLTVDQIERNCRIAEGLRRHVLTLEEATAWATDL